MEINNIVNLLCAKIPRENILVNEQMKNHTSFKIGGPADLFIIPVNTMELLKVMEVCRAERVPYYIIGNGSNLLIDDMGFRGAIIQLYKNFCDINIEETIITAQSGALLSKIASTALEHELTGFEFAQGIPGTLGGAVAMNAGAYGGEIRDVIIDAEVIDQKGHSMTLSKEELKLGYRTSSVAKNNYTVIRARLSLKRGDRKSILETMKDLAARRRDKQPLDMPSAGSTFKRPEGYFAGKLIMDAGLRGYKIGGAMISEKHCGFVVSDGTATFNDVRELIDYIQQIVKQKFNVDLQPEVKIISYLG